MNRLAYLATIVRHYIRARRNVSLRGDRLRDYQDALARGTIAYAMEHSPFYRRHYEGLDPLNWRSFPVVDKRIMMEQFDDFNTCGVSRDAAMQIALAAETSRDYAQNLGDLTIGLSSGTSGHRGIFLVDRRERASWAGSIMARLLPGLRLRGYKVLLFLRSGSNLYDSVGSRWLDFRFCDLMTPLDEAVAILNDFQPHILVAPPSMLAMLAVEQKNSRLKIQPARVISVAEVLDPVDETGIAVAFGGPVHQIYQCTEGLIAATCGEGNLHVLEDCVALQYEPVDGDPTRVGPIVTDLWHRSQPILRYRLNDILILEPKPCPCGSGFQRLARIEGRQDDVLYFRNLDGRLRPFFPDVLRRIVLLASPDITDYEITQDQPGSLQIYFASNAHGSPHTIEAVCRSLRASTGEIMQQYKCVATSIRIEEGLPPRRPDQKRRRVRRLG